METSLCLKQTEIRCAEQIPSLAAWVIEYAWSHRMMDVLEGLLPCMRQEGELRSLTLEEPCALRVAAAQAWSVVNTRDIEQFEGVLELLESIYTLVPRLVPAIKHMKIMFGLKTMIVMWMLQKNHGEVGAMTKIVHFFPSRLSLYRGCSKRELDVMRRSHCEFKQLAQTLLFHKEVRKAYIRDQMEDQYGERYAQKLEERLFDYLQLLERDLPPTTCIDQVLRQERPLVEGEQLLLEVLSCSPRCVSAALRRLYCAKAMLSTGPGTSQPTTYTDKEQQTPPPLADPKDSAKWTAPPAERVGRVAEVMGQNRDSENKACLWVGVAMGQDGMAMRKEDWTRMKEVTPPHQFHTPRSYQGQGRDTTSSLASAETVGLRVGISLESQLVMMRSQMLQPTVQVRRLTQRECDQATGRTKITPDEEEEQGQESDESEEEGESDSWESDFSYSELDSSSDPNYNPF
ncbi:hypothetical protein SKAU_G00388900 [Synaphobranchus kaupii]|uniref:TERF1-interacting nuclear factor 2 N-terminal domain-containing protein n=1 Tax=Synaphobranchus kaupii TaxID=118154 RepID=A0A9Q1IBE6_SYNKA|nr:hypothetical protein SKAU_G00388900 [Synaphobranchus kaupii]